jgi:hypothetical protein
LSNKHKSYIISQDELVAVTGYSRPAEIAACLTRQGVRFLTGKRGRIFTTLSALEDGMGLRLMADDIGAQKLDVL